MISKAVTALLLAFTALACGSQVVRDADAYRAELQFFADLATRQGAALKPYIREKCCVAGVLNPDCREAADLVIVAEARVEYHRAMALYNGGLLEEAPGAAPAIPATETICK